MDYSIADDIIPAVRIVLDYNEEEDALGLTGEDDNLALDTIIESQALDALRYCLMNCRKEWVTWSQATGGSVVTSDDANYYEMTLPDGFLRFGSAKLSTWKVPCYDVVGCEDTEYIKQFGEFDGLKATALKPVVAVLPANTATTTTTVMQMFGGVKDGTTLTYCTIAELPTITEEGTWTMKSQLLAPMVHVTAAFTANVLKDTNRYNNLMNQAKILLTTAEESAEATAMQAALAQQQQEQ